MVGGLHLGASFGKEDAHGHTPPATALAARENASAQ
jgi:hypothetical protein